MNEVDIIYLRQVALIKNLILIIGLVVAIAQFGNKKPIKMLPIAVILILLISYFFASFPIDFNNWWNDHMIYAAGFYYADTVPNEDMSDPLFKWLTYGIRIITDNCSIYFFVIAIMYCSFYLISSKRFCNRYGGALIMFILFITSNFFVSYGVNTLRAGLAMSVLILAFSYFQEQKIIFALFALCAINIHFSVALTLCSFIVSIYIKKPKMCFTIWLISIILSFSMGSYFEELFAGLVEDRRTSYLLVEADKTHYNVGFRWDFIVYSLIPILMGYYYIYKRKYNDFFYNILYCTYLLANTFWILVIRANFTDRFAYLSWALMPIILIYPLINGQLFKHQNYAISFVILINVAFTFILSL